MATELIPREKPIVYCIAAMAFVFQFDAALVTVSLPDMARELNVTSGAVSLVMLSYLLGAVVTFVPAGKLGDRKSLRKVCLAGCLLATGGTLLCGFATTLELLCLGRLVQGIGAGAFVAVGYAMMPSWISQDRVGWGYGIQSLGAGVGMVAGVPAGGVLSQFLSWQWIFLSSVPLFISLLVAVWRIVPDVRYQALNSEAILQWDVIFFFAGLMVALTAFLAGGPLWGWTSSAALLALMATVLFAAGLTLGDVRGRRIFSRQLFQGANTVPALGGMLVMAAVASGIRYVMPFYFENASGLSVLSSSYAMLAYPAGYAPISLLAGRLSDRFGSRRIVILATVLCAAITAAFVGLHDGGGIGKATGFLFIFGATNGLYFAPGNRWIMSGMPKDLRGEAGGLLSVVFNFGSLLGVALFDPVMAWRSMMAGMEGATGSVVTLGFVSCFTFASLLPIIAALLAFRARTVKDQTTA